MYYLIYSKIKPYVFVQYRNAVYVLDIFWEAWMMMRRERTFAISATAPARLHVQSV